MSKRLREKRQTFEALRERRNEIRRNKSERKRQLEELREEHERAEDRARAEALTGGGPATATARGQLEELEERITELETEEERLEDALEEARETLDEALIDEIGRVREDAITALRGEREALAGLGDAALDRVAKEVEPARDEVAAKLERLADLTDDLGPEFSGEPRRRLKQLLRQELDDLQPEEALGYVLARAVRFCRHHADWGEPFASRGLEPFGGSIEHASLLTETELHALAHQQRLPRAIEI